MPYEYAGTFLKSSICSKYLLHNNLLETYLSRSTSYQDQPGLYNFSDSEGHTQAISQPGLTPRL